MQSSRLCAMTLAHRWPVCVQQLRLLPGECAPASAQHGHQLSRQPMAGAGRHYDLAATAFCPQVHFSPSVIMYQHALTGRAVEAFLTQGLPLRRRRWRWRPISATSAWPPEVVTVVALDGHVRHEVLQLREGQLHARWDDLPHQPLHLLTSKARLLACLLCQLPDVCVRSSQT